MQREFPDTFKVWCDSFGGDAIGLTCGTRSSKVQMLSISEVLKKMQHFISQPYALCFQKRDRDDIGEDKDLVDVLRAVGECGKGFVKSVHLLKAPKVSS